MTASTPASCKDKGRRFQQEIAAQIRAALNLPEADVVSRPMGSPGADIILSSAAQVRFPFAVECKRTEKWELHQWWKQAQNNAAPERGIEPLLVFRRNREDTYTITTRQAMRYFAPADIMMAYRGPAVKWPIKYWMQLASTTAAATSNHGTIPVVSIKNGSRDIVLLYFADLLRIIRPGLAELAARKCSTCQHFRIIGNDEENPDGWARNLGVKWGSCTKPGQQQTEEAMAALGYPCWEMICDVRS